MEGMGLNGVVDHVDVKTLTSMGFTEVASKAALKHKVWKYMMIVLYLLYYITV